MSKKLQEEVVRALEHVKKEREWVLCYGSDLNNLLDATKKENLSMAQRLIRKLAYVERRVHLFKRKVEKTSKLFEKESLEGDELEKLDKQLDVYENRLVVEDSKSFFGPTGRLPKLLKIKPIDWKLVADEVEETYKEGVAPLVEVLDEIGKVFETLNSKYLEQRAKLSKQLRSARETKYNVFKTRKSDVERGLSLEFNTMISNLSNLGTPVRILDLGCGDGLCLKQLFNEYGDQVKLYGISIKRESCWKESMEEYCKNTFFEGWSDETRERAMKKHRLQDERPWNPKAIIWRIGHSENLTKFFKPEFFHLIYSHHGIMHSNNFIKALRECNIILHPQGMLAFDMSEPQLAKVNKEVNFFRVVKESKGMAPTGVPTEVLHMSKK